jgi:hypothetical protein
MCAIAGGASFFLSCLLNLAFLSGTAFKTKNPLIKANKTNFNIDKQMEAYELYTQLDIPLLRELWEYRSVSADLSVAVSAWITLSFFLLLATVMSLADAFEAHTKHTASHTMLIPSFLIATSLVVLDLTFNAGQATTSAFLYEQFAIPDATLQALELSFLMTASRELWTMGMVWFFLLIGMSTAAYLNGRSGMLYSSWTLLSVLIAIMSFIGFIAEIGRLRFFLSAAALDIALAVLVCARGARGRADARAPAQLARVSHLAAATAVCDATRARMDRACLQVSFFFMPAWMIWSGVYLLAVTAETKEVPVGQANGGGVPPANSRYRDDAVDAVAM